MSVADIHERVFYCETGDGARLALTELFSAPPQEGAPTFLLIHGFAQNRRAFTGGALPCLLLERGARVFLGELRGHGRSQVSGPRDWSLKTHLEQDLPTLMREACARAKVDELHLVGHSMGGMLGYALLQSKPNLRSLITFGAPLLLGRNRPLVRIAALAARPVVRVMKRRPVRIDLMLGVLARSLSDPNAGSARRAFQKVTRLVSPSHASPLQLVDALRNGDAESSAVFREMLKMPHTRVRRLAGIDMVKATEGSSIPVVAIIGSQDIFAPRGTVAPLEAQSGPQSGPRLIIEVPGGAHVDVTLGYHLPATVERVWDFIMGLDNAGSRT